MARPGAPCDEAWEALRFDVLPWLLDGSRPNLHWRVLIELIGRPSDSPAVLRAAGGASAVDPVAELLSELAPDGSWSNRRGWWTLYGGNGWRLVAAIDLGADPRDPRLQAGLERLVEDAPGRGGFAPRSDGAPAARLTATVAAALLQLGWARHPRVQEALAWLEEDAPRSSCGGWAAPSGGVCPVVPTALLHGLAAAPDARGPGLCQRAAASAVHVLSGRRRGSLERLGHPGLRRTDLAEMFAGLARNDVPWEPRLRPALSRLQQMQDADGRWSTGRPAPTSLPLGELRPRPGAASRWITLRGAVAVMRYAIEAGLPRLFPPKPGS